MLLAAIENLDPLENSTPPLEIDEDVLDAMEMIEDILEGDTKWLPKHSHAKKGRATLVLVTSQ